MIFGESGAAWDKRRARVCVLVGWCDVTENVRSLFSRYINYLVEFCSHMIQLIRVNWPQHDSPLKSNLQTKLHNQRQFWANFAAIPNSKVAVLCMEPKSKSSFNKSCSMYFTFAIRPREELKFAASTCGPKRKKKFSRSLNWLELAIWICCLLLSDRNVPTNGGRGGETRNSFYALREREKELPGDHFGGLLKFNF